MKLVILQVILSKYLTILVYPHSYPQHTNKLIFFILDQSMSKFYHSILIKAIAESSSDFEKANLNSSKVKKLKALASSKKFKKIYSRNPVILFHSYNRIKSR